MYGYNFKYMYDYKKLILEAYKFGWLGIKYTLVNVYVDLVVFTHIAGTS